MAAAETARIRHHPTLTSARIDHLKSTIYISGVARVREKPTKIDQPFGRFTKQTNPSTESVPMERKSINLRLKIFKQGYVRATTEIRATERRGEEREVGIRVRVEKGEECAALRERGALK